MRATPILATATFVLALTACSSESPDTSGEDASATTSEAAPTQEPLPAGEHTMDDPSSGGKLTINFPAEPTSPDVSEIATHLESVGAPTEDLVYMTVDHDNREGTESSDPSSIWMTDEAGGVYTFQKTMDVLDSYAPVMEWPDDAEDPYYTLWDGTEIPEEQYDELNSASTEMYNASLNGVPAGARETTVYVYDGSSGALPEEFTGITAEDGMGSSSVGAQADMSSAEPTAQN